MKIRSTLFLGLLVISGCASTGAGSGIGAKLSSSLTGQSGPAKIASTIISAMGGGLVGGKIGAGLTEREKRRGLEAEYKALEYTASGQTVTWKSDTSNRYGEVVAAQPYRVGSQDCRQYTHTVFAGGPAATARGTACRNADGSWTPLT
ncbi:hypothetical protein [Mesorhizobium sp. A556]